MDWMARAAWCQPTDSPDVGKARRNGVWYVYLDAHDPSAAAAIGVVRTAGLYPCLYFAQNWRPDLSPEAFADWASGLANQLLPKGSLPEAPAVELDLEVHDANWIASCLRQWRKHQPHRPTSYTGEPFQGGFVPYATLWQLGIHYRPQCYFGDMSVADPAAVVLEACRYGQGSHFDAHMVHPFYDGRLFDPGSQRDGCYFTLESMP